MPTVSFEQLGVWIVCALLALDVFFRIAAHQREVKSAREGSHTTLGPSPLEVKQHAGTVSREELKQVHGRIERERREIDAAIALVAIQADKRADKMDLKLDENTKLTSEMNGQLQQMNQSMAQLSQTLTQFMRDQARHH